MSRLFDKLMGWEDKRPIEVIERERMRYRQQCEVLDRAKAEGQFFRALAEHARAGEPRVAGEIELVREAAELEERVARLEARQ